MLLWKIPEDLLKEIKASNCYTLIFGEATGLSKKSSTILFKICWQQKNFWNLHKVMIALLVNICLGLWKKHQNLGKIRWTAEVKVIMGLDCEWRARDHIEKKYTHCHSGQLNLAGRCLTKILDFQNIMDAVKKSRISSICLPKVRSIDKALSTSCY